MYRKSIRLEDINIKFLKSVITHHNNHRSKNLNSANTDFCHQKKNQRISQRITVLPVLSLIFEIQTFKQKLCSDRRRLQFTIVWLITPRFKHLPGYLAIISELFGLRSHNRTSNLTTHFETLQRGAFNNRFNLIN